MDERRLLRSAMGAFFIAIAAALPCAASAAGAVPAAAAPAPRWQDALTLRPADPLKRTVPMKYRSQQQPTAPGKTIYHAWDINLYAGHMIALIQAERFDLLEQLYAEFADGTTRTTDGRWMLETLPGAFENLALERTDADGKKLLTAWAVQFPESSLRRIAAVALKKREAWRARGGNFADRVSPEGWAGYKRHMAAADALLEENKARWMTSPLWYLYKLSVVAERGKPAEADAVFIEATRHFSAYLPLYVTRLIHLTPKWGGSFEQADAFIRAATTALRAQEGESTYAWLYVAVAQSVVLDTDFLRDTDVSWPQLKTAFDDLLKRYPDDLNRNMYAGFACAARDRAATGDLLRSLGPGADIWTLGLGITMDGCRAFAFEPS